MPWGKKSMQKWKEWSRKIFITRIEVNESSRNFKKPMRVNGKVLLILFSPDFVLFLS